MRLPLLEQRTAALETCAYCPKLSRAACPVSNADARETTTPWGKMTSSFLMLRAASAPGAKSRGAMGAMIEPTKTHAWPAWACTGCFACRQACELRNDVAGTLLDARADFMAEGLAPDEATRIVERHAHRVREADDALELAIVRAKTRGAVIEERSPVRLVVGCMNARTSNDQADVAADAVLATSRLVDGPIDVVRGCCGAPLRNAGDRAGFAAAARAMNESLEGAETIVAADSGCAHTVARRWAEVDVHLPTKLRVLHLSELAAREINRIWPLENNNENMRYHDACHLGRGLGVYEAPRAVLTRLLGRAPEEFARRRENGTCSGGGGALPVTYTENARAIAASRLAQHDELGGGAVVTTCASSRKMLGRDGTRVVDLATLVARGIERAG